MSKPRTDFTRNKIFTDKNNIDRLFVNLSSRSGGRGTPKVLDTSVKKSREHICTVCKKPIIISMFSRHDKFTHLLQSKNNMFFSFAPESISYVDKECVGICDECYSDLLQSDEFLKINPGRNHIMEKIFGCNVIKEIHDRITKKLFSTSFHKFLHDYNGSNITFTNITTTSANSVSVSNITLNPTVPSSNTDTNYQGTFMQTNWINTLFDFKNLLRRSRNKSDLKLISNRINRGLWSVKTPIEELNEAE